MMKNLVVVIGETGEPDHQEHQVGESIERLCESAIPFLEVARRNVEPGQLAVVLSEVHGQTTVVGVATVQPFVDPIVVELHYPAQWTFVGHSCLHRHELVVLSRGEGELLMLVGGSDTLIAIEFEDEKRHWDYQLRKVEGNVQFSRSEASFTALPGAEEVEYEHQLIGAGAEHGGFPVLARIG